MKASCKPSEDVCLEHSRPLIGETFCDENCKHENADHLKPGDILTPTSFAPIEQGCPVLVEQFRCLDCGAWLSLGHSDETDEHVAIEIRAAEIAQAVADNGYYPIWPERHSDEIRGWSVAESNMHPHSGAWLAGYLARQIATHTEES